MPPSIRNYHHVLKRDKESMYIYIYNYIYMTFAQTEYIPPISLPLSSPGLHEIGMEGLTLCDLGESESPVVDESKTSEKR